MRADGGSRAPGQKGAQMEDTCYAQGTPEYNPSITCT